MTRHRSAAALLGLLILLLGAAQASAAEDVYSERTLDLARRLQCPVCAGQSVADSSSGLAREMRDVIEQKVQAGESDQQIIDYFVARYGESVLSEPPKSGFSLALWWLPVAVVLLGGLVVAAYLKERTRRAARPDERDETDEELEAIARDVLGGGPGEKATQP